MQNKDEIISKAINAIDPLCCARTDVQMIKVLDAIGYWGLRKQVDTFNNVTIDDIIVNSKKKQIL